MPKSPEIDLDVIFQGSAAFDVQLPKWLTTEGKPVQAFYSTMKLWGRLRTQIKELSCPSQLSKIFPVLKSHAPNFPSIVGYCEARPEMLTMLKDALVGMTYGCIQENREDLSVIRYHSALDTVFGLLSIPDSEKCHRPQFITRDSLVEKALASTIQNIFKIVVSEMQSEGRDDYADYMIYACTHFASTDSKYSRAGKVAIAQAFKDFYSTMPPEERALITSSTFYTRSQSAQSLIDKLTIQARCEIAQTSARTALDKKLG